MKNFETDVSPNFFHIFRKGAEKWGTQFFLTIAAFRDAPGVTLVHLT